jgi:hypothetical protein
MTFSRMQTGAKYYFAEITNMCEHRQITTIKRITKIKIPIAHLLHYTCSQNKVVSIMDY